MLLTTVADRRPVSAEPAAPSYPKPAFFRLRPILHLVPRSRSPPANGHPVPATWRGTRPNRPRGHKLAFAIAELQRRTGERASTINWRLLSPSRMFGQAERMVTNAGLFADEPGVEAARHADIGSPFTIARPSGKMASHKAGRKSAIRIRWLEPRPAASAVVVAANRSMGAGTFVNLDSVSGRRG